MLHRILVIAALAAALTSTSVNAGDPRVTDFNLYHHDDGTAKRGHVCPYGIHAQPPPPKKGKKGGRGRNCDHIKIGGVYVEWCK